MKKTILFIFLTLGIKVSNSQELNCQVTVQAAPSLQISAVDKEIFSQMEKSLTSIQRQNNSRIRKKTK